MKRTPLERKSRLRRKKRIKPMSEKRKAENEVRAVVLMELAAERGPRCEANIQLPAYAGAPVWVCTGVVQDGHEKLRRSQGGDATDPANILLVCRGCHDWIHTNIALAIERELLSPSWLALPPGSMVTAHVDEDEV